MILGTQGRDYYDLTITTAPAVTAWEASFDDGGTWHAGENISITNPPIGALRHRWLLAGPATDQGDAVAVIERTMTPKVRAVDDPAIIVRGAPPIFLVD